MNINVSGWQAFGMGVAILGCATAALLTGHLTSDAWLTLTVGVGVGAGVITSGHVGSSNATNAAVQAVQAVAPQTLSPSAPVVSSGTVTPLESEVSSIDEIRSERGQMPWGEPWSMIPFAVWKAQQAAAMSGARPPVMTGTPPAAA